MQASCLHVACLLSVAVCTCFDCLLVASWLLFACVVLACDQEHCTSNIAAKCALVTALPDVARPKMRQPFLRVNLAAM